MCDEHPCECEIQLSPKDMSGRAGRHGPERLRTLPGEASVGNATEESAEVIVV